MLLFLELLFEDECCDGVELLLSLLLRITLGLLGASSFLLNLNLSCLTILFPKLFLSWSLLVLFTELLSSKSFTSIISLSLRSLFVPMVSKNYDSESVLKVVWWLVAESMEDLD